MLMYSTWVQIHVLTFLLLVETSLASAGNSNKTTSDDAAVETILERIDALVAGNQVYVDEITSDYLASHAPALYAISVIGFVGAFLNSVAICLVILWVRSLKSAVTQIDTTMP